MTTSKPCACGRPGCTATKRSSESAGDFVRRRYSSISCVTWHRNMTDPRMSDARSKGARSQMRGGARISDGDPIGLVTPVEWLDLPPVRIRLQRMAEGIGR